jgi:MFS transporter, ACS family, hexuronate transporter
MTEDFSFLNSTPDSSVKSGSMTVSAGLGETVGTAITPSPRSPAYQMTLVVLLSLNFGIVFFDRNALNFLMPFVQPDLGLSNTHVGLLASALSLTWAVAGLLIGRYSDRTGRRKSVIVAATVAFSACSVVSGIATTFLMLFAARLLMGFAEGAVLPISQSLTASELTPARRGLAMGVMQNVGSNALGSSIAPLLLVAIATAWGWRHAFFIAAIPGLLSAALIWAFVKEPAANLNPTSQGSLGYRAAFADRNVRLCALISILLVSHAVIGWAFLPLLLTTTRGFDPNTMGWMMATLGVSASVGGFVAPAVSDRFGRKPVMIIVPVLSLALPLGAIYFNGSHWLLAVIFFIGWSLNSLFPLVMATIPSESVDSRHMATVLGLVMGVGEVFGGVLGPFLAGSIADRFGLLAPVWIMLGLCIAIGLLSLGLRETAPRIIGRSRPFGSPLSIMKEVG